MVEGGGLKIKGSNTASLVVVVCVCVCAAYVVSEAAHAPVTPRSLDTNRAIAVGESSGSPFRIANTGSSGAGSAAAAGFGGDALRGDFFLAHSSSSLGVALLPDVLGRAACSSAAVILVLDV